MRVLNSIVLALIIVGAINWGCIGLFGMDLVAMIFGGQTSALTKIVYILIGLSGLWGLTFFKKIDD